MSRCKAQVPTPELWSHPHQCRRQALEGGEYCKTHDPVLRNKKYEEERKRWKADWDKQEEIGKLFKGLGAWITAKDGKFEVGFVGLDEEAVRKLAEKVRS